MNRRDLARHMKKFKPYYCPPFVPMIFLVPEGREGAYEITHYDVTKDDVKSIQIRSIMAFDYREYHDFQPGRFCRMKRYWIDNGGAERWNVMMSDTTMERRTNRNFVTVAKGDVLIAGLGIGLIVYPILQKESVERITIIESEPEIITLMQDHVSRWAAQADKPVEIVQADIEEWELPKDKRWDTIYFDIWDDICGDNWEQMKRLTARFKYRRNPGGWMGAWRKADMREAMTGHYREDYREGFAK